jgi:5-methylcytosine-specific restriction endonuclease McrA
MPIVLSQRIDTVSEYKDIPFVLYHYPKRYRNQIKTGDIFIYYQGDRYKKDNRYYFGYGVIGDIEISENEEDYYAHILEGIPFPKKVPIYHPESGFYESLDYDKVRQKPNPSWQNSARKLSDKAYQAILNHAGIKNDEHIKTMSFLEDKNIFNNNPLQLLEQLNNKYKDLEPKKKNKFINSHVDRGKCVTDALKKILGAECQICNWEGFLKNNGERYIEAHHLSQLSLNQIDSLCSDNVILLCPNCHRKIHYAKDLAINNLGTKIKITLEGKEIIINKNTVEYLRGMN